MAKKKAEVEFDRCKSINPQVDKQRCGLERGHPGSHRSTEVIDEWPLPDDEGKSAVPTLELVEKRIRESSGSQAQNQTP